VTENIPTMSGAGSLLRYISSEVTRSYLLEHDQERYTSKREKMYTFMRIPRELEKFMSYGFFHCLDSFLFVFTFLPLRVMWGCMSVVMRYPLKYLGISTHQHRNERLLHPAEIIDLLKCFIICSCCYAMSYVDTSMLYHMIKSQSVIKLYLMYNMIEVADRLFLAFGQDTIDALFWTATEPRGKKRDHIGIIPHVLLAVSYVFLHSMLFLLQATTLNVAINASNKALLTIMMSNNFVELKGSVFKKFDKNNFFQVSCSDVRERFHLFTLLFVVVVQTMKEYGWREESFWSLAPDCILVLGAEILVDWVKHAFITRFNDLPAEVYHDYTISLAYDLAQTKQKYAFSDHSDIVTRRMGFIPLPIGVVMLRVVYTSVKSTNPGAWAVVVMAYLCLLTFRILGSIVILGKACDLIDEHKIRQENDRKESAGSPSKTSKSPTFTSKINSNKNSGVTEINNEKVSAYEAPGEDLQEVFMFEAGNDDREDVLFTTMNSTMLNESTDLGHADVLNIHYQDQETLTPNRVIEVVNASLLGPAAEASPIPITTKNHHHHHRERNDNDIVIGSKIVRSYSSPDLVTEGSGDDWVGDVIDGAVDVTKDENATRVKNAAVATVGFNVNNCDNTEDNDNRRKFGEE